MTGTFEIVSLEPCVGRLLITAINKERIAVSLERRHFAATTKVYFLFGGDDHLSDYFADLAKDWRGWPNEKTWRSYEGEMVLSASSDGRGHVTLHVTLEHESPWTWRAEALLEIEAGQLDRLAAAALDLARYLKTIERA